MGASSGMTGLLSAGADLLVNRQNPAQSGGGRHTYVAKRGRSTVSADGAPQRLTAGQESLEPDTSPGVFLSEARQTRAVRSATMDQEVARINESTACRPGPR